MSDIFQTKLAAFFNFPEHYKHMQWSVFTDAPRSIVVYFLMANGARTGPRTSWPLQLIMYRGIALVPLRAQLDVDAGLIVHITHAPGTKPHAN